MVSRGIRPEWIPSLTFPFRVAKDDLYNVRCAAFVLLLFFCLKMFLDWTLSEKLYCRMTLAP